MDPKVKNAFETALSTQEKKPVQDLLRYAREMVEIHPSGFILQTGNNVLSAKDLKCLHTAFNNSGMYIHDSNIRLDGKNAVPALWFVKPGSEHKAPIISMEMNAN